VRGGAGGDQPPAANITELEQEISAVQDWAKQRRLFTGNKRPVVVSDLVSADPEDSNTTLQWVNLVMAGGGMLGIGHVGFVRVLEQAGVRFIGLGGASAGAINALLIAAVRERPDRMSWQSTGQVGRGGVAW
jgi:predicted acylesterase/phospholipase RssA